MNELLLINLFNSFFDGLFFTFLSLIPLQTLHLFAFCVILVPQSIHLF